MNINHGSNAMSDKEMYLGDGVYASFDGWQICLRAPRENGDHVVYLEPQLFEALLRFARQFWQRERETIAAS